MSRYFVCLVAVSPAAKTVAVKSSYSINSCWTSEFSLGKPQLSFPSVSTGSWVWSYKELWSLSHHFLLTSYSSNWPRISIFYRWPGIHWQWLSLPCWCSSLCYLYLASKYSKLIAELQQLKENLLCICLGIVLHIYLFSQQISEGPYTRHHARPRGRAEIVVAKESAVSSTGGG